MDSQDRDDIDYRAGYEHPHIRKVGCGYRHLMSFEPFRGIVQRQREAEQDGPEWVFQDADRVAKHTLARLARLDENSIQLKQTGTGHGHRVYEWRVQSKKKSYMVVVSHPYLAAFYARDPARIAWIAIAAFEEGCHSHHHSIIRIR